jgi:hypothetical protein
MTPGISLSKALRIRVRSFSCLLEDDRHQFLACISTIDATTKTLMRLRIEREKYTYTYQTLSRSIDMPMFTPLSSKVGQRTSRARARTQEKIIASSSSRCPSPQDIWFYPKIFDGCAISDFSSPSFWHFHPNLQNVVPRENSLFGTAMPINA